MMVVYCADKSISKNKEFDKFKEVRVVNPKDFKRAYNQGDVTIYCDDVTIIEKYKARRGLGKVTVIPLPKDKKSEDKKPFLSEDKLKNTKVK